MDGRRSGVRSTNGETVRSTRVRHNAVVTFLAAVDTRSVGDAGSSAVVLIVSIGLVLAGIGLTGITVWFWRSTRPDPEALAPLVVMSTKRWIASTVVERRQSLDLARPGAVVEVLEPVADAGVVEGPEVDGVASDDEIPAEIEFATVEAAPSADGLFDDLDEDSDLYDLDPIVSSSRGDDKGPIDPLLGR